MKGLIICCEIGAGLRSLAQGGSSSLLSLANRRILEYQLSLLHDGGIRELMVVAAQGVRQGLREILDKWQGLEYKFLDPQAAGESYDPPDPQLLFNSTLVILLGPLITDIDLGQALSFHRQRGGGATLFLHTMAQDRHRSLVLTDGSGRVIKVLPQAPEDGGKARTAGSLYILEPDVSQYLLPGLISGREEGICPHLLKVGIPVYGFPVRGYWQQVQDLSTYFRVHEDILSGRAKLSPAGMEASPGIWLGQGVELGAGVELVPPLVLGAGVRLGDGVRVEKSVLGAGTFVDGETTINNSLLLANCFLGRGVVVEGAVLGEDTIVAGGTVLEPGVFLSPQSVVSRDSFLGGAFGLTPP